MKKSYEVRWGHSRTKKSHGSARKIIRRQEAEARQVEYDALTDEQKKEKSELWKKEHSL
jgi:hypothetical protein